MEGRSRRQNIRIVRLPDVEGLHPSVFFQVLIYVLGSQVLFSPPELDKAHWSPVPKSAKTRSVILRFHRFQMKELVICEAHKKSELIYNSHRVRFYEDYSPDVVKNRGEFKAAMSELYKQGFKPVLLFLMKLHITLPSGERRWFVSASGADKFVQDIRNETKAT